MAAGDGRIPAESGIFVHKLFALPNFSIRQVWLLGMVAITLILLAQGYWLVRALDIAGTRFHEQAIMALNQAAHQMAEYQQVTLPVEGLVTPYSSNYFIVNYNQEIDRQALEFFLKKNLSGFLPDDYEYAVYDCSSKTMVYGKYISQTATPPARPAGQFETQEGFPYYFGVRFPNRAAHLLEEAWMAVVFSAIMLVAIGFFMYAMWVILRQRQYSQLQRDFINTMTHEFKTPISTIQVAAEVIGKHESVRSDARLSQYTRILQEQNQRLNQLVEKVLTHSRYEKERFPLVRETIDLNEVLETVAAANHAAVEAVQGTLRLNLSPEPARVFADPLHLTNVLHNLVDNALKHSGLEPEIVLSTEKQPAAWLLSVSDTGKGIPAAYRKQVFGRFFRVHDGAIQQANGFGLGLYYVKSVCEKHGWKIRCVENQPRGLRMEITIPSNQTIPAA